MFQNKFVLSIFAFGFFACENASKLTGTNEESKSKEEENKGNKDQDPVEIPVSVSGAFLNCEINLSKGSCVFQDDKQKKISVNIDEAIKKIKFFHKEMKSESLIDSSQIKLNKSETQSSWHFHFVVDDIYINQHLFIQYTEKIYWDSQKQINPKKPWFSLLDCKMKTTTYRLRGNVLEKLFCDLGRVAVAGQCFCAKDSSVYLFDGPYNEDNLSGWQCNCTSNSLSASIDISVQCCSIK